MRAALARSDPPITVIGDMRRVAGYVNDIWFLESDAGPAVAKVRNLAEEDPEQIRTYVATMDLLRRDRFPTPRLLIFEESCDLLDGRQLSVLEHARGVVATEAAARTGVDRQLFWELGRTVGRLHSIDLPADTVWRDDTGVAHDDWTSVVLSSLAEARTELDGRLGDDAWIVDDAATRIRAGATGRLTAVTAPRLVHRDLHLGNFLVDGDGVSALLDFEMVREWDPAYDFVKITNSIFQSHRGAEDAFLGGYRELAPTSNGFESRVDLYVGLHHVLSIVEFLDGNTRYRNSIQDLQQWLTRA